MWGSDEHVPRCGVSALVYVTSGQFLSCEFRERTTRYTMLDVNRRDIDINVTLNEYWCIIIYIRMFIRIGRIMETYCVGFKRDSLSL